MRWRQLSSIVGEMNRIAHTLNEALDHVANAVEHGSDTTRAASEVLTLHFERIADAIELLVAAQLHREPIKCEASESESLLESFEREEAHKCPICRRLARLHNLDNAADFLRKTLKDGPRYSGEVFSEATTQGFSKKTIYEAAKKIDVLKKTEGSGIAQRWVW
jgi:hypothetical protein